MLTLHVNQASELSSLRVLFLILFSCLKNALWTPPKILRTAAGTEGKIAHRWEVYKDLFHLLREHGLPRWSSLPSLSPLPPREERARGHQEGGQAWALGMAPPEPYPWAVFSGAEPGSGAWGAGPSSLLTRSLARSLDDNTSHVRGVWYFSKGF